MLQKTYDTDKIVVILRNIEILNAKEKSIRKYDGMHLDQAKCLKKIEKENDRLKKLPEEIMLDNHVLTEGQFETIFNLYRVRLSCLLKRTSLLRR